MCLPAEPKPWQTRGSKDRDGRVKGAIEGNTGKPESTPYQCWEAAESGRGSQINVPPKTLRYESYLSNTGSFLKDAKEGGE